VINFNHVSAFNECINKWGLIELVDPARSYTWSNNPRGAVRDPRASTTYVSNVDGGPPGRRCRRLKNAHHLCQRRQWWAPWEVLSETRECPPPMSKTSIAGPLGGAVGDPGAPTTYVKDFDGGPPGKRYRRPGSAHHLCQKRQWGG
jgi:hypothetical protein